jgi:hypothetical protein
MAQPYLEPVEPIDSPHMAVINAIEMVRTGIAFEGAIKTGRITRDHFPERVLLDLGGDKYVPIPTGFDPGQLEKTAHNLGNATILTAVIAADSALDAHFKTLQPPIGRPLDRGDSRLISDLRGVEALRALLYMIRNAFAHDPFNPRWEVRSANRRGTVYIEELGLHIDLAKLNGEFLDPAVWGGMTGLLDILRVAERVVRPKGFDLTQLGRASA